MNHFKLELPIMLITSFCRVRKTLTVVMDLQNLTVVSQDLNVSVTKLLFNENNAVEFNNTSFILYVELEFLMD